jgi:hypothetical protein
MSFPTKKNLILKSKNQICQQTWLPIENGHQLRVPPSASGLY